MTSDRVYRKGKSYEALRRNWIVWAGRQFDKVSSFSSRAQADWEELHAQCCEEGRDIEVQPHDPDA